MSVSVYCDNNLLYSTTIESLKIISPIVSQEDNKTGSFTFTIYPDHPYFSMIQRFKSIITVYDDGVAEPLFRGRIISDEQGFYNEKHITCEGELAFLIDSIQRPYEFTGTPTQLFTQYIANHNSQVDATRQFTVGNVTVTDPNNYIVRSNSEYVKTWDEINDKLLNMLGGHLWVRHVGNINYIDYLEDFSILSNQKIEFASNLLDLNKVISADEFATAIIPLGAKDETTGERLTINSVNNNVDYVYNSDAVAAYGYIFTTNTWDDVTQASNLKTKAQAYIDDLAQFTASVEVSAADLAGTGADVNSFRIGRYVKVKSNPHGINDQNFLISKLERQLDNPANTKLTLGTTYQTLTDKQNGAEHSLGNLVTRIDSVERSETEAIYQLEQQFNSTIEQTSQNILTEVSQNYYLKDETDSLISSVNTTIEQNAEAVQITFTEVNRDITDLANGTDTRFEEINSYIRFEDGNIILGESGNLLTLKIENDKISFMDNNHVVAYFSNNKLYVTDGEFLSTLRLGNFAFSPRTNGNLSFTKIV